MAATMYAHEARRAQRALLPALEPGFRNSRAADEQVEYEVQPSGNAPAPAPVRVRVRYRNLGAGRLRMEIAAGDEPAVADVVRLARPAAPGDPWLHLEDGQAVRRFRVIAQPGAAPRWFVHTLDGDVALVEQPRFAEARKDAVTGGLSAPMPGKVVKVLVAAGQAVAAGDTLLVLEAMKMEHPVRAPADGVVSGLAASEGEQVDAGQLLAVVTPADA
jgi:biotin carboxyl carrier protein